MYYILEEIRQLIIYHSYLGSNINMIATYNHLALHLIDLNWQNS